MRIAIGRLGIMPLIQGSYDENGYAHYFMESILRNAMSREDEVIIVSPISKECLTILDNPSLNRKYKYLNAENISYNPEISEKELNACDAFLILENECGKDPLVQVHTKGLTLANLSMRLDGFISIYDHIYTLANAYSGAIFYLKSNDNVFQAKHTLRSKKKINLRKKNITLLVNAPKGSGLKEAHSKSKSTFKFEYIDLTADIFDALDKKGQNTSTALNNTLIVNKSQYDILDLQYTKIDMKVIFVGTPPEYNIEAPSLSFDTNASASERVFNLNRASISVFGKEFTSTFNLNYIEAIFKNIVLSDSHDNAILPFLTPIFKDQNIKNYRNGVSRIKLGRDAYTSLCKHVKQKPRVLDSIESLLPYIIEF
jgi:hypothetical protein